LGLPIGGDSRKLCFWKHVVDRIVSRLSSWNNMFLSFFKVAAGIISSIESIPKKKLGWGWGY